MKERRAFVYIDLEGEPILVGRLWSRYQRGRETASFEYDNAWLSHPWRFALEPALSLDMGQHHTGRGILILLSLMFLPATVIPHLILCHICPTSPENWRI
jgi:serine/threonine-protein kinase HipA